MTFIPPDIPDPHELERKRSEKAFRRQYRPEIKLVRAILLEACRTILTPGNKMERALTLQWLLDGDEPRGGKWCCDFLQAFGIHRIRLAPGGQYGYPVNWDALCKGMRTALQFGMLLPGNSCPISPKRRNVLGVCRGCGRAFSFPQNQVRNRVYCSVRCAASAGGVAKHQREIRAYEEAIASLV